VAETIPWKGNGRVFCLAGEADVLAAGEADAAGAGELAFFSAADANVAQISATKQALLITNVLFFIVLFWVLKVALGLE
jgi:hypothetical protein